MRSWVSQRDLILSNPTDIIRKIAFLYLIFILLHIVGYLTGYKQKRENKVAIAIGAAYMNNGMAIVTGSNSFWHLHRGLNGSCRNSMEHPSCTFRKDNQGFGQRIHETDQSGWSLLIFILPESLYFLQNTKTLPIMKIIAIDQVEKKKVQMEEQLAPGNNYPLEARMVVSSLFLQGIHSGSGWKYTLPQSSLRTYEFRYRRSGGFK